MSVKIESQIKTKQKSLINKIINTLVLGYVICMVWLSRQVNSGDIIFSPFNVAEYDLTSQSGTAITIKIAKQANIVAVACGLAGVIILDGKTQEIKFQKVLENETVKGLAITKDGKYIMLGYQGSFSIFEYKKDQAVPEIVLVSQTPYIKGVIQDVILNSQETIAYAYGTQGSLVAFDIKQKDSPQQIGAYFSSSAQVRRAIIAKDDSFLYLADDVQGLVLLKIKQVPEFELVVATKGGSTWWQSWAVAITSNKRYAYVMDNWDGIWIADLQNVYDTDEDLYPVQVQYTANKFWPYLSPSVYSGIVTKDDNYLMIGHRSQGVQIIDIRNKTAPVHYLTIPSEAVGFDLRLSDDEQYLYYANAKSIIVFTQSVPNLNNHFPNLHNFHQTKIDWFCQTKYLWRCAVSSDDKYFYGYFNDDGLYIMNSEDPYNMKFQSRIMPHAGMSIDMAVLRGNNYLYIGAGSSKNVIYEYDITDKQKPIQLKAEPFIGNTDADGLYFNDDYSLLAVCNYSGVLLFDTSNPKEFQRISYWPMPASIFGSCKDVTLSKDLKYAVGAVRGYGIFVIDIQNRQKPVLKFTMQTSGAEGMVLAKNKKYVYLFDGFRGLAILDITKLPSVTITSRLQLTGWSNFIVSMFDDQYLLIDTYEKGQLSLVDIKDVANPLLISKYDSKLEAGVGVCTTHNQKYSFIITDKGVRTLPLTSEVTIHTQISQVIYQSVGQPILKSLSKDDELLVGQTIQFNFIIVRPIISMAILNVYYYDKYEMKSLPYWMNYQSSSQSLTITVVKEALGQNLSKANLNTVIIKTAIPLTANSFVYNSDVKTTEDQGKLIWQYLLSIYLLDSNNFVTSFFDHNQPFKFQIPGVQVDNMQRLYDLVKLTLMRGVYYNPILFYVAPSLYLDLINSKNPPILTTSQNIVYTMVVSELSGKFVKQTLSGVIVSYTDSQNQIKIEGSLENVNAVLSQKIYFSMSNSTNLKLTTIAVSDGKNYDVVNEYQIDKIPYISLNVPTKAGKDLQPQVNSDYKNGRLPIESDISITFLQESFVDPDTPVLQYSLQQYKGGEYINVPSDFFLALSPTELRLSGKTKENQLYNKYELRIRASDGYSEAFNNFELVVDILPFFYVLNLLIKIFGPIIGVFGIYKYKSDILNMIYKKKTRYTQEIAIVNTLFRKQITIMGNDLERARQLYKEFKNKLISKENIFAQEEREKKMYYNVESINTIRDEDLDKKDDKNYEKFSQTRRLKHVTHEDDRLTKAIYALQNAPSHKTTNIFEKLYLRKDGTVAMTRMYRDMLQLEVTYNLNGKTFSVKKDTKDFQNKDSRLFKCLQGIVARDFIQMDIKANIIYEYMKYYASTQFTYTQNDWYKVYVNVTSTDKRDKYDQQVPFSDLLLKDEIVNRVLMDLNLNNQKGQTIENLSKANINHHLIKMNLFCDALGITQDDPSFLCPCVGESLHLQFFEVHSVEAFKHIKNAWFMRIRKCLGLDYMSFGLSKNMTLPHWLQFDQKNGVIVLEGIPAMTDVDELLIRVYDETEYIVQHFMLKIVDEYNAEQDNVEEGEGFNNSQIFNANDSLADLSSPSKTKITHKEKSMHKISQFKIQNSTRLIEQNSNEYDINSNPINKITASPPITSLIYRNDQVDELFFIKQQISQQPEDTTQRLFLDKEMSTQSNRNNLEVNDRSYADGNQNYSKVQQRTLNNDLNERSYLEGDQSYSQSQQQRNQIQEINERSFVEGDQNFSKIQQSNNNQQINDRSYVDGDQSISKMQGNEF